MSRVSPIGRIPVLETDSGLIPESEVIAEYLDDSYPDRSMVGATPEERANVRVLSRIGDIYLMNNIFLSLGQMNADTRSDAVVELLIGQVRRGLGALERHLSDAKYAAGDTLTRADCTLVPSLWMCTGTIPRLGVEDPVASREKVAAYWRKIQKNPHAARVIDEMNRGLQARVDGTERKMAEEAIARAKKSYDE